MRKIAICDDNIEMRIALKNMCNEYYQDKKTMIELFDSGEILLCNKQKFDLIFLDIQMSDLNGIEVAHKLRETDMDTIIIIISGYSKYKSVAYNVHPFDYIDKPINRKKIYKILGEIERYLEKRKEKLYITFETVNGIIHVDKDDILYLEYDNRKIVIHLQYAKYFMYGKISDYAKELYKFDFICPHRAYLVNMENIQMLDGYDIIISGVGKKIPISKLKKKEVYQSFYKYLSQEIEKR